MVSLYSSRTMTKSPLTESRCTLAELVSPLRVKRSQREPQCFPLGVTISRDRVTVLLFQTHKVALVRCCLQESQCLITGPHCSPRESQCPLTGPHCPLMGSHRLLTGSQCLFTESQCTLKSVSFQRVIVGPSSPSFVLQ